MKILFTLAFSILMIGCGDVVQESAETVAPKQLSHVEEGIADYKSCVFAGMKTIIIGENEVSKCTSTDGRTFSITIPKIWKKMDITKETKFMACVMGGLPVDRTDPENPVCIMPDGRVLTLEDSEDI